MNAIKTVFLLVLLSGLFLVLGYAVGGQVGLVVALVFSLGMNFFSYWFSDKLALRMAGATEVTPDQEPHLHRIVDEVSAMAGMPKPKVYVTPAEQLERALGTVQEELGERLAFLRGRNRLLEAQRLEQRTLFDMEMLRELGYCHGIENYSRHLSGRKAGEPPPTLLD